jgi:hypothetical protein
MIIDYRLPFENGCGGWKLELLGEVLMADDCHYDYDYNYDYE